jgi:hypothetical protein
MSATGRRSQVRKRKSHDGRKGASAPPLREGACGREMLIVGIVGKEFGFRENTYKPRVGLRSKNHAVEQTTGAVRSLNRRSPVAPHRTGRTPFVMYPALHRPRHISATPLRTSFCTLGIEP